jgi:hypothetical protein
MTKSDGIKARATLAMTDEDWAVTEAVIEKSGKKVSVYLRDAVLQKVRKASGKGAK